MQETIINFFTNINIQDYIIFGISVGFFILFLFTGIEKIYKAYLGIILGLFIFTTINLSLSTLNDNNISGNIVREFFTRHKDFFGFYSILFIPILTILIPLNKNISFRVSQKKGLNYIVVFLFGLFYFSFLVTIFLSIINNRFLFSMDNTIIEQVRSSYIIKSMYEYFSVSVIFGFLTLYDYIINLFIILFIFYKMTIGGVVDFVLSKLLKFLLSFFDDKGGGEKHHAEHEAGDNHGHDDHHDSHGGHDNHRHH